MEINLLTLAETSLLIVVGFFCTAVVAYWIDGLIEGRRVESRRDTVQEQALSESPAYGSEDCYRDCVKRTYPFSERQYPSCAVACGLSA